MTDRNKLICLLAKICPIPYREITKVADCLVKNGYTITKDINVLSWIPVTERLPDKFGEYIVAIKTVSGVVYSDYADFDRFSKRWTTGLFFEVGSKVTHWMPLPDAPKE